MNYFSFGNGFGQNFNNYYDFRIRSVSKGARGKRFKKIQKMSLNDITMQEKV